MQNAKSMSTPLAAHFRLSTAMSPQNDEEKQQIMCVLYVGAMGSMMNVMLCTYPNISHAVSIISRYIENLAALASYEMDTSVSTRYNCDLLGI